jgi:hypothetical protein
MTGTLHRDLHEFLRAESLSGHSPRGKQSNGEFTLGESPASRSTTWGSFVLTLSPSRQAPDTPPTNMPLTPEKSDITEEINKDQRPNPGKRARTVMVLTCFVS